MNLGSQNKIKFILFFLSFIFYSNNLLPKNANGYAVTLGALDKITAKFSEFNINVEETGKFGTLKIQVFECQKRPPEEIPENFALLKIEDEVNIDESIMVFSGWMISSSPSLSPLEHSTYDIWLKDCIVNNISE